jgi:hypothetical protein
MLKSRMNKVEGIAVSPLMKRKSILVRWAMPVIFALGSVSCMTTYDQYGRPMQTVDPAVAVAGAAAAGLIAYSIADNRNDRRRHHRNHHYGYGSGGYGYGGYGGYGHCNTYGHSHGW